MSSQGGLRHAAPEPVAAATPQDNRRERRRGAAGRASALRRAPSDSDCSGETASLSADSGERAARPPPPPVRSGKSRSRRRGSEWEVLEGLKDGQRFERRPDVFNGYLHKKRKWPLKGWHKRFFVIDGGILVYARSPADVARGRLHGSVDVGLSVISAKARRRRIDIDADEFIYHLRAKTPDVFRTWLSVLKAHRLYRQHLLMFGAREPPAARARAPLDSPPPPPVADNSANTSISSIAMSSSSSGEEFPGNCKAAVATLSSSLSHQLAACDYPSAARGAIDGWCCKSSENSELIPLSFDSFDDIKEKHDAVRPNHRSLCSMNCLARMESMRYKHFKTNESPAGLTDTEKHMHSARLDVKSHGSREPLVNSSLLYKCSLNSPASKVNEINTKSNAPSENLKKRRLFFDKKLEMTTTALFFFAQKKRGSRITCPNESFMRKSKKCTNLVKYRNLVDEPPLRKPLSRSMLLANKYKVNSTRQSGAEQRRASPRARVHDAAQALPEGTTDKSLQHSTTTVDYDRITDKLMMSIFDKYKNTSEDNPDIDVKYYINLIVKELYDGKWNQSAAHPVKTLFRCLLEYWLRNSSLEHIQEALTRAKSVDAQSNKHFTHDENLSSYLISNETKATQFRGLDLIANIVKERKPKTAHRKRLSGHHNNESYVKEQRIQELERLLKSTVYICETGRGTQSKEKDIEVTKRLIDHLSKFSKRSESNDSHNNTKAKSNSSTELPKIQETINHLLGESLIPPDVAKEFLGAYLDMLLQESSKSFKSFSSSTSTDDSKEVQNHATCEVLTESVQKKVSKSITTILANPDELNEKTFEDEKKSNVHENQVDPGQLYLKDILDKITTIFSKVNTAKQKETQKEDIKCEEVKTDDCKKDELVGTVTNFPGEKLISENLDDNSVVINLSKYDLEHVSMFSDPAIKGMMSITFKLKDKPADFREWKRTNLSLKFSEDKDKPHQTPVSTTDTNKWLHTTESEPHHVYIAPLKPRISFKNPYLDFYSYVPCDKMDLKPYLSTSDATSKRGRGCQVMHESKHSLDLSFESSHFYTKDFSARKRSLEANEDPQSCYIMSFKKSSLANKLQSKKKAQASECEGVTLNERASSETAANRSPELSVIENPTLRTIDEKFILLLLENLTLLSKSLPSMHKDINGLYTKLIKKHEKVAKNQGKVSGLGLLGKIYNEANKKSMDDNETQFEHDACPYRCCRDSKEVGLNTSFKNVPMDTMDKRYVDECLSAFVIPKLQNDAATQTVDRRDATVLAHSLACSCSCASLCACTPVLVKHETSPVAPLSLTSKVSSDIVTETNKNNISKSIPYNQIHSRNREANYSVKCLGENNDRRNFRFKVVDDQKAPKVSSLKRCLLDKKETFRVRQSLIKETKLLSPSVRVSTQSQTDRTVRQLGDKKARKNEFKLYRLFVCNRYDSTKSSSIADSNDFGRSDDLKTIYRCSSDPSYCSGLVSPTLRGPQAGFVSGTPGGRLASWIVESGGPLENATRELGQAQLSVQQLQRLLDALELQHQVHHDADQISIDGASPSVKKDRRKFGLRKKKSNSKCASVELCLPQHADHSSSYMALSALTAPPSPGGGACSAPNSAASLPIACAAARPQSLPGAESLGAAAGPASLTSLTPDQQLREDFTVLAKDLLATLKGVVTTLVCERVRLRSAMEAAEAGGAPSGAALSALRSNLSSALHQNSELRSRLARIHDASDLAAVSSAHGCDPQVNRPFQQSLSYSSSCVSASEFFDAEEHEDEDERKPEEMLAGDEAGVIELDGDSSSEAGSLSSEEGSASSDNSDAAPVSAERVSLRLSQNGLGGAPAPAGWSRRTRLPCPRPTPGGPSLWNLLYKNIGKDLSQISMPVTINEPLNMLQRLCEELEYSELLDAAAACASALERMALVAAFAVSAYAASAHRAASKPFNPLLAETYECVRDDRGFRFIAEQVSHHPPVSACHAESPRWCFWQEARIKTKFWGKSMEFQPAGRVHVRLATTGDHYSWNKVTTCVHNLFGGQRWVDQYGDMHIVCHGTDISCKLNFIKASSWSSSRHEVRGAVTQGSTGARLRLQGRWSEALYAGEPPAARCLWRPGAMPPEHELYYGFTRFAMELNELEPGMRELLPHSDTRLRPDQRALEEGDIEAAESYKHELEQAQRERRRDSPPHEPAWFRKVVEGGEETWVFTGEYWKAREAGFSASGVPRIW